MITKRYIVCTINKQHRFLLLDEKDDGKEALDLAKKLCLKVWHYKCDMIVVYDMNYNHAIAGFNRKGIVKDKYEVSKYDRLYHKISGFPDKTCKYEEDYYD